MSMQSALMLMPRGLRRGQEKAVDTAVFIPRRGSGGCLKINGTCGESAPTLIMSLKPASPPLAGGPGA